MKPNLILLHGALSDGHQFDSLKPILENDFTIHTLDFEGHGDRQANGRPFRAEHHMQNILDYAEENGIDKLNLFGYSMGGYAALLLAARFPGRVASVFTLATKITWNREIAMRETAMLDAAKMQEKIPAFVETLKQRHTALGWERVVEETVSLMNDLGENDYLNRQTLSAISCPVHIARGDKDRTVSQEECDLAAETISDAELELIPDAPHPFEKVDLLLLAESMRSFYLKNR